MIFEECSKCQARRYDNGDYDINCESQYNCIHDWTTKQEECIHGFDEYIDRSGMFINKKCRLCGFMRWGIEEYMQERAIQKQEQGAQEMPSITLDGNNKGESTVITTPLEEKEMSIKFIVEDKQQNASLNFAMVKNNQFYIDYEGHLCQKIDYDEYVTIATPTGEPFCFARSCEHVAPIQRILPRIKKIEF